MNVKLIKRYCVLSKKVQQIIQQAVRHYKLSARSYNKILKVARTIADLAERDTILTEVILL
jgi:magnesium chelatase family protein